MSVDHDYHISDEQTERLMRAIKANIEARQRKQSRIRKWSLLAAIIFVGVSVFVFLRYIK